MRRVIIILLVSCGIAGRAQGGRLSGPEKCWALFHPFAAIRVKKIYKAHVPQYNKVKSEGLTDHYESGGRLDAYRHSFFMAAFAQHIGSRKLRKLGKAHEKGNYRDFRKHRMEYGNLPDSLSSVMDLCNNELGISIGRANKELNAEALSQRVTEALKKGEGVYLKRNESGQFLNCRNELIKPEDYQGKWSVPKCLIPTNE